MKGLQLSQLPKGPRVGHTSTEKGLYPGKSSEGRDGRERRDAPLKGSLARLARPSGGLVLILSKKNQGPV